MMNKKSNINFRFNFESVFVLYAGLTMAVYILPSLKITVPYIYAALIMLAFLPIAVIKMQCHVNYYVLLAITTLVSSAFYFVNGVYGSVDTVNEIIRALRFFLPIIWAAYAFRFCSAKQRRNILIIFAVIVLFMLIKTIHALEKDAWIARILAQDKSTDTAEIRAYRMGNVGGFEFSYMVGVVVLCLTWAALKYRNIKAKILCIVGAAVCFYYIIQTMYMTLLLLTFGGVILLLFFKTKSRLVKIAIVLGSIVVAFSLAPLFKYLSEVFSGSLLSTKFMQFYTALTGGGADSLGSRPELIREAVARWLKSPIWGGYETSVRTHSMVFALLEATGLIGLLSFLGCLFGSYKMISDELKKNGIDTLLISTVFMYILALATLNPVGYVFEVTIAAFFIAPLWSELVTGYNDSQ